MEDKKSNSYTLIGELFEGQVRQEFLTVSQKIFLSYITSLALGDYKDARPKLSLDDEELSYRSNGLFDKTQVAFFLKQLVKSGAIDISKGRERKRMILLNDMTLTGRIFPTVAFGYLKENVIVSAGDILLLSIILKKASLNDSKHLGYFVDIEDIEAVDELMGITRRGHRNMLHRLNDGGIIMPCLSYPLEGKGIRTISKPFTFNKALIDNYMTQNRPTSRRRSYSDDERMLENKRALKGILTFKPDVRMFVLKDSKGCEFEVHDGDIVVINGGKENQIRSKISFLKGQWFIANVPQSENPDPVCNLKVDLYQKERKKISRTNRGMNYSELKSMFQGLPQSKGLWS